MRIRRFRYALSISAAATLLAGCGGSQPPIGAPATSAQASRADRLTHYFPTTVSYQVLHRFGRHANPEVAPLFWTRNRPFLCDDLADYAAFLVG